MSGDGRPVVCSEAGQAAAYLTLGRAVVLMVPPGPGGEDAPSLRASVEGGGGRAARFVGDPDDPVDLAAACAMAAELFGGEAVVAARRPRVMPELGHGSDLDQRPDVREMDMASSHRIALAGSDRAPQPGHEPVGAVDPAATATVTVYLRERPDSAGLGWVDAMAEGRVGTQTRLTRNQYAAGHGAATADVEAVRAFAADHGLTVGEVDLARRSVQLTGPLADLAAAFGTELAQYRHPTGAVYRGRRGLLTLPADIAPAISGVFGLDERPQAKPHFRVGAAAGAVQYLPTQVAALYDYPAGVDGRGEAVALIELGGGFRPEDLTAYFAQVGVPAPSVTAVGVDGGANSPGSADGPDGEVMLDIEVVGAVAPGASIVVYFAPNTDQGFIDAVTTAVHDPTNKPSVVSISWGDAEASWTAQAMTQMEQAFTAAGALGVTVTVACGDNGSTDGDSDGLQHADFPASAPHALACGGTTLHGAGTVISDETVWNDLVSGHGATGGGISDQFGVPSYQQAVRVPPSANPGGRVGRGIPDVAGDADPETGYTVRVDGQTSTIGGTSAVAPLWAALIARLNQALGQSLGFAHPLLYAPGAAAGFHDIVQGSNGAYDAGPGWDACSGLGSPDGAALLAALQPPAGGTPGSGSS